MVVDVNYFPSYAGVDGAAAGLRDVVRACALPALAKPAEAAA